MLIPITSSELPREPVLRLRSLSSTWSSFFPQSRCGALRPAPTRIAQRAWRASRRTARALFARRFPRRLRAAREPHTLIFFWGGSCVCVRDPDTRAHNHTGVHSSSTDHAPVKIGSMSASDVRTAHRVACCAGPASNAKPGRGSVAPRGSSRHGRPARTGVAPRRPPQARPRPPPLRASRAPFLAHRCVDVFTAFGCSIEGAPRAGRVRRTGAGRPRAARRLAGATPPRARRGADSRASSAAARARPRSRAATSRASRARAQAAAPRQPRPRPHRPRAAGQRRGTFGSGSVPRNFPTDLSSPAR